MDHATSDFPSAIAADLSAWFAGDSSLGDVHVSAVERVETGRSGFLYGVTINTANAVQRCVLRLPPAGVRPVGPADVMRQGRIMNAIHEVGFPVPRIVAQSSDPVVLGRPFVLMERVDGTQVDVAAETADAHSLAASVVTAARRLHSIPIARSGIGDEEPTTLRQELQRWSRLMDRVSQELVPDGTRLHQALVAQVPDERPPTLVHADFHMGNMLFNGADVVAVLDWEIAEIGQPLIDLGCLCTVAWRRRFGEDTVPGGRLNLTVADYLDLYGAGEDEMRWYIGFSLYKYAAILAYSMHLHLSGRRHDPSLDTKLMSTIISGMITDGLSLASGDGSAL
jgi:aminoglycoside phosphotransferase (APT) family kinase protein